MAERGIVDDFLATEAALDAEDWEILGEPPPDERPGPTPGESDGARPAIAQPR